jgi:heme/copper-type cytochrome/quinol oxidase subunit 3
MIFRRPTAPRRGHVFSRLLLFLTLTILLAGGITFVLAILSFVRGDSAVTSIALLFGSCIVFAFVGILLHARRQLIRRGQE